MAYCRVFSCGLRSALAQSYCRSPYSSSPMIIASPLIRNKHMQPLLSSTCTNHFSSGCPPSEAAAGVKPKTHEVKEIFRAVEKEIEALQDKIVHMEKRQQTILEILQKLQGKNHSTGHHHLGTQIMKKLNDEDTAELIVGLGFIIFGPIVVVVAVAGCRLLLGLIFGLGRNS